MRKVERSKAYPGTNLEDSINNLKNIKKALGISGSFDRKSFAQAMGYNKETSKVSREIAALVQFGLLEKQGNLYSLSKESKKITNPVNENEEKEAIIEAFRKPKLYSDVIEQFSNEKELPSKLSTHLHRFHGIAENASENAAKFLCESGVYANVLDQDGKFFFDPFKTSIQQEEESEDTSQSKEYENGKNISEEITKGDRTYSFPLANGMALMKLPGKITKKDLEIIKGQISILEIELE